MAGITLTGMASGLDTDSIISQLMALEQNKVTAVQMRQVKVQAHKDDLGTIKTKLEVMEGNVSDARMDELAKAIPNRHERLLGPPATAIKPRQRRRVDRFTQTTDAPDRKS